MSTFTVIEDCSPYYIRFTHSGIEDIVDYCKQCIPLSTGLESFKSYRLLDHDINNILSKTPVAELLPFENGSFLAFISAPGFYYRAHKDGLADRFAINYPIVVQDDKCITSWYADEDLKDYAIDNLPWKNSRECADFDRTKHKPLKSMIAKPGECILFNTEIFHDWNNTESPNLRAILTLRIAITLRSNFYFEDAKKILFSSNAD